MPSFRFAHPMEVRYADLDAQRHVNNVAVFSYMETARAHYLQHLGLWDGRDFDSIGIIVGEASCRYLAPISYGQRIEVAVAVTHLGRKSVTVEYAVRDVPSGEELATGRTILVTYDYRSNQSIAVPETWRKTIEDFEAGKGS
ncbi:MAG TPA: thioesterase family protein [Anaerolineales bacterium]|nr:thioesterase family protein [Anaerolineales bacterium]